jgi:glycosyltransferase involved in cell wall biosynthesis
VLTLEGHVRLRVEGLGPYSLAHWSRRFLRACREEARRADVVHDHGVWLFTNWSSCWSARAAGKPLIRSPRGMLSRWSLARRHWRKQLLWSLVERRLLERADVLHVTGAQEAEEIRTLGMGGRLEVIPNGIDTEGEYSAASVERARAASRLTSDGTRRILFLSRIHAKKGLDILQDAWAALPPDLAAVLEIAGSGDAAEVARIERWVRQQPGPPARYLGPVDGEGKVRLLASAWAFALPSHSENYGMAIAEALACGTPVVTSTQTPWGDVETEDCGRVVELRVAAVAEALRELLALGPAEHGRMRIRARRLIERRHSLRATGARFEALCGELVTQSRAERRVP